MQHATTAIETSNVHSLREAQAEPRCDAYFDMEPLIDNALCAARLASLALEGGGMKNEALFAVFAAIENLEQLQEKYRS